MGTKFTKDGFINDDDSRPFINGVDSSFKLINLNAVNANNVITVAAWTNNKYDTSANPKLKVLKNLEDQRDWPKLFGMYTSRSYIGYNFMREYTGNCNFYIAENGQKSFGGVANKIIDSVLMPKHVSTTQGPYTNNTVGMATMTKIATDKTLGINPTYVILGNSDGVDIQVPNQLGPLDENDIQKGFGCWIVYYYDDKIHYVNLRASSSYPELDSVRRWLQGDTTGIGLSFYGAASRWCRDDSQNGHPLAFGMTANGGDAGTAYIRDGGLVTEEYYRELGGGAGACAFGIIDPRNASEDNKIFVFCSFSNIFNSPNYAEDMYGEGITALYELDVWGDISFGFGTTGAVRVDTIQEFHERLNRHDSEVINLFGLHINGKTGSGEENKNKLIVALQSGETGNCEERKPVKNKDKRINYCPKGGDFTIGSHVIHKGKSGEYGYAIGENYSIQVIKGNDSSDSGKSSYKICFGGASKVTTANDPDTLNICKAVPYNAEPTSDNYARDNCWGQRAYVINGESNTRRLGGSSVFAKPTTSKFSESLPITFYKYAKNIVGLPAGEEKELNYGFGGCALATSKDDVPGRRSSYGGTAALIFFDWDWTAE